MRPTVREVSKQYKGSVRLVVVNMYTDSGEQRAAELGVRGHPAMLFQDRHGTIQLRRYGPIDKGQIQHGFAMLADAP